MITKASELLKMHCKILTQFEGVLKSHLDNTWQIDGRLFMEVVVGDDKLKIVAELYIGDMLSAWGSCKIVAVAPWECTWDRFHQFLPLLINLLLYSIQ